MKPVYAGSSVWMWNLENDQWNHGTAANSSDIVFLTIVDREEKSTEVLKVSFQVDHHNLKERTCNLWGISARREKQGKQSYVGRY